jgi:hypothetical protein
VGLRVQARVGVGHLQDLLYSVETVQPSIFIDKITITAGTSGERDVETNPTVEVTVEIYGFRGEESTRLPEDSAVQILRPRSARLTDMLSLTVSRGDKGARGGIE